MDFGNELRIDFAAGKFLGGAQKRLATGVEFLAELVKIEPRVVRPVVGQVGQAAVVQLFCAAQIAVAKMVQAHGYLNKSLVKAAVGANGIGPQGLPRFVGLEEIACVKVRDALQVQGRIVGRGRSHGNEGLGQAAGSISAEIIRIGPALDIGCAAPGELPP